MTNALDRIADALEGIESMMRDDRKKLEEAEEAQASYVDPSECPHPKNYRTEKKQGAQLQIGCQLCESANIYANGRAGVL